MRQPSLAVSVTSIAATMLLTSVVGLENSHEMPRQEAMRVLSSHKVIYSEPPINEDFKSDAHFDPRGMQYVYVITHTFLDLVQREDILPTSINASELMELPPERIPKALEEHWQDIVMQYIGVITVAVCGLLLAIAMPLACFCMCCCRCAGKCGAFPDHYDKKSDACKRFCTGVVLAVLTIAATFGVVCAFVTNYYCYDGMNRLPENLQSSSSDAGQYLDNTGQQVNTLLVANFAELEEVLGNILDESGPILKRSLAEVTQAVAIDDLTDIVSNLGNVRRYLRDIQNKTLILQDKVGQLALGLNDTSVRLMRALNQCSSNRICTDFLDEYNISRDLAIAASFSDLPSKLPDLSLLMKDISDLMNNDIERKVSNGQKQLDKVKVDIEKSIGDIRPKIKVELRKMGKQLEEQANYIQSFLNEIDVHVGTINDDIPSIDPIVKEYSNYTFYIGLGMSFMVLLILMCHVFGLFYGFCGKRPDSIYGDDCCNTGTGANWLLASVYLTFIFSFVLLLITTARFLVGSTVDRLVCESLQNPNQSEVFRLVDEKYIQPFLLEHRPNDEWSMSFTDFIQNCHQNQTLYQILKVESVYNVYELRNWRKEYGISDFIDNLKKKIKLDDLRDIQILSPEAERELLDLAESQISDLNFSQYTKLLEEKITSIDLNRFTSRLRQVRERLNRNQARIVGPAIDNEALFLDQMQRVVMDMKMAMRDLDNRVTALEAEAKLAKPNLREALRELISQATKATRFLRREGPQLVDQLTDRYVNETVGLIDDYVERVINRTLTSVGRCSPLSTSYNSTVIAMCNEIVDPFNGFWSSIGWCLMFFLPSVFLSVSLVTLYRKSEPYPGPLVEPATSSSSGRGEDSHAKKKRRGHRRNASEYLPDSAHYRAGYSYQNRDSSSNNRFHDVAPRNYGEGPSNSTSSPLGATAAAPATSSSAAGPSNGGTPHPTAGGPPKYSSNPNLATEYERPPPYYFPGESAPPPLPAPNPARP